MSQTRTTVISLALAFAALSLQGCGTDGRAGDKGATVEGKVVRASSDSRTLEIKTTSGKELNIEIDADSRLRLNNAPAKLSDFSPGTPILVTYEVRAGKNRAVSATGNPETVESVKNKVKDALQAAKNYTYDHKDEYAQKLQGVVDDVNTKVAELKTRAEKAGTEAKAQLQPQIDELRRQNQNLQKQLDKVKAATPGVWDEIKTGAYKALEDLQDAWEKVKEKLT